MAVNLPRDSGKPVPLLNTPLADCSMRFAKTRIGSKVYGCCHVPSRQLRTLDPIVASEPLDDFRSYFDRALPVVQI